MAFKLIKTLGWVFLALALFAGFAWWWLFTIPVSHTALQRLSPGMTQAQVYSVLGAANQTNVSGGETLWIYSRKPCVVALLVRFDYSGFKEYVID